MDILPDLTIDRYFDEISQLLVRSDSAKKDLSGILRKTANEWKLLASMGKASALPENFVKLLDKVRISFPEILKTHGAE